MRRTQDEKAAQCARNVEAWVAHFRAPAVEYLEHRWQPWREDRVLIHAPTSWLEWLADETAASDGAVYPWNIAISDHHPLSVVGIDENTAIEGWRGRRVFTAIQLIHHLHHELSFLEVDFDLANPATGVLGSVSHGLEWSWYRLPLIVGRPKRKTNPFLVARHLRKAGILLSRYADPLRFRDTRPADRRETNEPDR